MNLDYSEKCSKGGGQPREAQFLAICTTVESERLSRHSIPNSEIMDVSSIIRVLPFQPDDHFNTDVIYHNYFKDLWAYESELWTAKGTNQSVLNSQFWSANVTEICLTSAVFNIQIPVTAPSLRSLFFEKRILDMTSQQWADSLVVVANPIFTPGCFEIGFNVGNEDTVRARLGIVTTHDGGRHITIIIVTEILKMTNNPIEKGFRNFLKELN